MGFIFRKIIARGLKQIGDTKNPPKRVEWGGWCGGAGHETKKVTIADVLRTELMKVDKWGDEQLQVLGVAVMLLIEWEGAGAAI